jgi:hypothetical protein
MDDVQVEGGSSRKHPVTAEEAAAFRTAAEDSREATAEFLTLTRTNADPRARHAGAKAKGRAGRGDLLPPQPSDLAGGAELRLARDRMHLAPPPRAWVQIVSENSSTLQLTPLPQNYFENSPQMQIPDAPGRVAPSLPEPLRPLQLTLNWYSGLDGARVEALIPGTENKPAAYIAYKSRQPEFVVRNRPAGEEEAAARQANADALLDVAGSDTIATALVMLRMAPTGAPPPANFTRATGQLTGPIIAARGAGPAVLASEARALSLERRFLERQVVSARPPVVRGPELPEAGTVRVTLAAAPAATAKPAPGNGPGNLPVMAGVLSWGWLGSRRRTLQTVSVETGQKIQTIRREDASSPGWDVYAHDGGIVAVSQGANPDAQRFIKERMAKLAPVRRAGAPVADVRLVNVSTEFGERPGMILDGVVELSFRIIDAGQSPLLNRNSIAQLLDLYKLDDQTTSTLGIGIRRNGDVTLIPVMGMEDRTETIWRLVRIASDNVINQLRAPRLVPPGGEAGTLDEVKVAPGSPGVKLERFEVPKDLPALHRRAIELGQELTVARNTDGTGFVVRSGDPGRALRPLGHVAHTLIAGTELLQPARAGEPLPSISHMRNDLHRLRHPFEADEAMARDDYVEALNRRPSDPVEPESHYISLGPGPQDYKEVRVDENAVISVGRELWRGNRRPGWRTYGVNSGMVSLPEASNGRTAAKTVSHHLGELEQARKLGLPVADARRVEQVEVVSRDGFAPDYIEEVAKDGIVWKEPVVPGSWVIEANDELGRGPILNRRSLTDLAGLFGKIRSTEVYSALARQKLASIPEISVIPDDGRIVLAHPNVHYISGSPVNLLKHGDGTPDWIINNATRTIWNLTALASLNLSRQYPVRAAPYGNPPERAPLSQIFAEGMRPGLNGVTLVNADGGPVTRGGLDLPMIMPELVKHGLTIGGDKVILAEEGGVTRIYSGEPGLPAGSVIAYAQPLGQVLRRFDPGSPRSNSEIYGDLSSLAGLRLPTAGDYEHVRARYQADLRADWSNVRPAPLYIGWGLELGDHTVVHLGRGDRAFSNVIGWRP